MDHILAKESFDDVDISDANLILQFITNVCQKEYFEINKYLDFMKHTPPTPTSDEYSAVATQQEVMEMITSSPHFPQTVNVAVIHIIQSLKSSLVDLIHDSEGRSNVDDFLLLIIRTFEILRNFFRAIEPHFQFPSLEIDVCTFLAGLVKLLGDADFTILQNLPVLSTVSQALKMFKELPFSRHVLLIELCKKLEVMKETISNNVNGYTLYGSGFYEKYLQILLILKDLLLYCVEWGEICQSKSYELDKDTLASLQKLLEHLQPSTPLHLVGTIQECLNLIT